MKYLYKIAYPDWHDFKKISQEELFRQIPELKPLVNNLGPIVTLAIETKDGYIEVIGRPAEE